VKTKVLITGGGGQLGNELTEILPKYFNVLSTTLKKTKTMPHALDITKFQEVESVCNRFNPDVIINTAAYTHVDNCETNKKQAHDVNVGGLQNIVKACSKNTRIIQISSDYIFDGKNGPYDETDQPNPINYYGKTKLEAENILRGFHSKFLIIRANVVYSSKFDIHSNFVSWVYNSLQENLKINVVTDQISNPTNTTFLANAIVQCILLQTEGIFHFGSEDVLSRYDFAVLIAKTFNLNKDLIQPITSDSLKQKARRPNNSGLSTNKIEKQLDLQVYNSEFVLNQIKDNMVS
jgi:dTDP-4-dehydrorhamnose reductase